jgi:FkbM family methyltransferase
MSSTLRQLAARFTKITGLSISRSGQGWELIEPEVLARFLRAFRVDCVFDVGANVGQYAKRLRQIGYLGLIISFEPNPNAFQQLEEAARSDRRWIVHQTALDSEVRDVTFNVMKSDQFSSLHIPDHSTTKTFQQMNTIEATIPITTTTLDVMFAALRAQFNFSRPFLKMDTQGHDSHVVAGGDKCLANFVGLQSELSLTPLYQDSLDFAETLNLYRSKGFKLSALVPNNGGHFPDLHEIDCIMYNPTFVDSDLSGGRPNSPGEQATSAFGPVRDALADRRSV